MRNQSDHQRQREKTTTKDLLLGVVDDGTTPNLATNRTLLGLIFATPMQTRQKNTKNQPHQFQAETPLKSSEICRAGDVVRLESF